MGPAEHKRSGRPREEAGHGARERATMQARRPRPRLAHRRPRPAARPRTRHGPRPGALALRPRQHRRPTPGSRAVTPARVLAVPGGAHRRAQAVMTVGAGPCVRSPLRSRPLARISHHRTVGALRTPLGLRSSSRQFTKPSPSPSQTPTTPTTPSRPAPCTPPDAVPCGRQADGAARVCSGGRGEVGRVAPVVRGHRRSASSVPGATCLPSEHGRDARSGLWA
jgi:hypothetical protein